MTSWSLNQAIWKIIAQLSNWIMKPKKNRWFWKKSLKTTTWKILLLFVYKNSALHTPQKLKSWTVKMMARKRNFLKFQGLFGKKDDEIFHTHPHLAWNFLFRFQLIILSQLFDDTTVSTVRTSWISIFKIPSGWSLITKNTRQIESWFLPQLHMLT